ncbi:sensor histidine kinase [Tenacibaculum sp. MEBiC06402]|uniref:sensor histidine kinase n=1 Tax=unclassified Tenacibaculum TaxID=2635139 RepID=UPI003B9B1FD6
MRKLLLIIIYLNFAPTNCQNFKNRIDKLYRYDLNFEGNNIESLFLKLQAELIANSNFDSTLKIKLKNTITSKKDSIFLYLIKGDSIKNEIYFKKESSAFQQYFKAYKKALEVNDSTLVCESLNRINKYCITFENKDYLKYFNHYSNEYLKFADTDHQKAKAKYFRLSYILQKNFKTTGTLPKNILSQFHENILFCKKTNNQFIEAEFYNLIGVTHDVYFQELDSSLFYYKKAKSIYNQHQNLQYFKNKLFDLLINEAYVYSKKGKLNNSNDKLQKAFNLDIKEMRYLGAMRAHKLASKNYELLEKHDSSLLSLKKSNTLRDSIELLRNAATVSFNTEQHKAQEKEKENSELKNKRKQDQIILLIGGVFIILGSLITYLNLKNSRKKRLLAEQQKELEKQKNLTLLKEQEITTINAMVEGQEKERIRIAEDLHDNIGSVLATLKLHFENLKLNREKKHFNQEELYNKTEKLIDETYLKVRSIAHAKNAGVIANQGLLVAIKVMAEKISSANQLNIEIVDYGLDKRLDSNTEITIFRIIQELITNIIKHAEASEATINISHFDDSLNIIIEDNGKGFNSNNINLKNGMGLASIKKRVEHLNGSFQIDSVQKRGTSIIINIPV